MDVTRIHYNSKEKAKQTGCVDQERNRVLSTLITATTVENESNGQTIIGEIGLKQEY